MNVFENRQGKQTDERQRREEGRNVASDVPDKPHWLFLAKTQPILYIMEIMDAF